MILYHVTILTVLLKTVLSVSHVLTYEGESNGNIKSYNIFIWLYLRFSFDSPSYVQASYVDRDGNLIMLGCWDSVFR